MSDHEAKQENNEMAAEDTVKAEEEKPTEEKQEENEKESKEEEEEESKETETEKEKDEEEEEENEVKEEEEEMEVEEEKEKTERKAQKEKKQKEEAPAKEIPSTPKKEYVPLYDQPLEMSGKRDRKKVERFVQETKKEELNTSGSGVALGDIPYIDAMITKFQNDELKVLHRVAFNRPGSGNEIKKNLRKFNGFPYTKEDKKYQSKVMTVERIIMSEIKRMLMILGLERQGNKAEVVERLMNFMLKPEDSGRKPPRSAKKAGKGRGRPSKKSQEKKQNNTSRDDSAGSGSDSDQSGSEDEDDENKEDEEEEEDEEEKKPKKTPGRKPAAGKKTPAKRAPAAKRTPAAKRAKPTDDDDDSDSDDEPLAKKVKQPPSDSELKVMIKKILEGANLEEVTMKSVCRQVYDSYPEFDLTHKKVFIKETVKSIIS